MWFHSFFNQQVILTVVLFGDLLSYFFASFVTCLIISFSLALVVRVLVHLAITSIMMVEALLKIANSFLVDIDCPVGAVAPRTVSRRGISTVFLFVELLLFWTLIPSITVLVVLVVGVHFIVMVLLCLLAILRSQVVLELALRRSRDLVLKITLEFPMRLREVTLLDVLDPLDVLLLPGWIGIFLSALKVSRSLTSRALILIF